MPTINCCPDYNWPTKLHCFYDFGCQNPDFPLIWDADTSQWVSHWNGESPLGVTASIACNPDTGLPEMTGAWSMDDGGACVAGNSETHGIDCDPSILGFTMNGELPRACCGDPPWAVFVMLFIGSGEVAAVGVPPEIPPRCSHYPPEERECCLKQVEAEERCRAGGCRPRLLSEAPVRYATGEIALSANDISAAGFGVPWGHTRSFTNRLSVSETLGHGFNWQVREWPYLVVGYYGNVAVLGTPNESLWFDKVDGSYVPSFESIKQTLVFDDTNNLYRLTDLDGTVTEFDGSTGRFQHQSDPAGNTIEVTAVGLNGFNFTQVERSYTESASTTTEQFFYEYANTTGDELLTSVTLRRQVDFGPWENVSRAVYTYYADGESHGSEGDLKTATTQTWDGAAWVDTGKSYYRYYASGEANGFVHGLKYALEPAAYARMEADALDPLTASNAQLALYADYYFEYDADQKVTKERIHGASREFALAYAESGFADAYNNWKTKTSETLPDGSQNIVYANYAGQTMLEVYRSGVDEWRRFHRYDSDGRVILQAESSAVSGYDELVADLVNYDPQTGNAQYLSDSTGLIRTFTWHAQSGYIASESLQEGELGTPIKLREYQYVSHTEGNTTVWLKSAEIVYPDADDQMKTIQTSWAYTFHAGTTQIEEKTTTLPAVPTAQNGSGVAAVRKERFDTHGNLIWRMDERGFITRLKYDVVTGALVQRIDDVDTSQTTDEPTGWTTATGAGEHLVTDFEHDDRGRIKEHLGPEHTLDIAGTATTVRRAAWTVYAEGTEADELRIAHGYYEPATDTHTLINPVSITRTDKKGNLLEEIQATRSSTAGKLLPGDSFPQSTYIRWKTYQYTDCCILASTRVYHTIPSTGEGTSGTNYDETQYGYDVMKRRNREVSPGGTITSTVLASAPPWQGGSRPAKIYVGTDDTGATDEDPTGGGAPGNNMVLVTENQYDGGTAGGDGRLTRVTQHVSATESRVIALGYDWRNRHVTTDGEIDFYEKKYPDNLDRVIKTERYDTSEAGNIVARAETKFDDRGRVFQTVRYGVDPSTGTVGNALTDNTWYDASGHVIKQQPSGSKLFTKTAYDGPGRQTKQYVGYDLDETTYSEAENVTGDTILEQVETAYDPAGNAIQVTNRQRYHNAAGEGELTTPSGAEPKARVTYLAHWHDAIGREIARADYGTNGGTALSRPSTVPARSDTVLVTTTEHNSHGDAFKTVDRAGKEDRLEFDHAGRKTKLVENYVDGDPLTGGTDQDRTTLWTYTSDGNVATLTAKNRDTGDQTTTFIYGTTLNDSDVARSDLLRAEIYPDSDDTSNPLGDGPDAIYDRIEHRYDRQSERKETTDQNGTVHVFDRDALGRITHDRVMTLGTGIVGAVRRISTTYEVRGLKEKVTSWSDPTPGFGSIVNELQFVYNDFGQLVTEYQSHSGAVDMMTTPKIQYGYADGSANTIRTTSLTYPNGRVVDYDYGPVNGTDDAASRVQAIKDGATVLAQYSYLGQGTFVEVDYTEPDIRYTLVDLALANDPDTGDIYSGLDRFGRVKDSRWYNYASSTDVDRIKHGYDRAGNRIWRENLLDPNDAHDELYQHDGLHRLKDFDRGALNAAKDAIAALTLAQEWSLDPTGNWKVFRQDDDGNATWDLDQARTANKVNEISDVTETAGPAWVTPAYDRAGNMTTIPKPSDPTVSLAGTYDAWNRLLKLTESANMLAEYKYDGAKRRIVKKLYASGVLDETRHLFYSSPERWQVLEERTDASSTAERQFVWGRRYMDDLVCRDRDSDSDSNGSLDERLYGLQDANWNLTAIADPAGAVQERYTCDAYGVSTVLTAAFTAVLRSAYKWEVRFAGYRWDAESGLFQVRHRFYAPRLGWLQRDPLGLAAGINLYEYALSNPLSQTDPTGMIAGVDDITILFVIAVFLLALWIIYIVATPEGTRRLRRPRTEPLCRPRLFPRPQPRPRPEPIDPVPPPIEPPDDPNREERERCVEECHEDYDLNAERCRELSTPAQRRRCWEQIEEERTNCIRDCNRRFPSI